MIGFDEKTSIEFDPIEAAIDAFGEMLVSIWFQVIYAKSIRPDFCPYELYILIRKWANKKNSEYLKGKLFWLSKVPKDGKLIPVTYNKKEYEQYLEMHKQGM